MTYTLQRTFDTFDPTVRSGTYEKELITSLFSLSTLHGIQELSSVTPSRQEHDFFPRDPWERIGQAQSHFNFDSWIIGLAGSHAGGISQDASNPAVRKCTGVIPRVHCFKVNLESKIAFWCFAFSLVNWLAPCGPFRKRSWMGGLTDPFFQVDARI